MAKDKTWLVAIPTAITLGNALCGFGAVMALTTPAAAQHPGAAMGLAGGLVAGAWLCDMFDGMAARMTGTTGKFGAALDSLCDVIGFGLAPAFLVATMARWSGLGDWIGGVAGAALLVGVLVRLARFDAEDVADDGPDGHMYFRGFPSPAVGMVVAAIALTYAQMMAGWGVFAGDAATTQMLASMGAGFGAPLAALVVAGLAVSTRRYPDLPKHYLKGAASRWHLAVLLIAMIGLGPGPALLLFFGLYALIGPWMGRRPA